jgi:hypothetical protein
MADRHRGALPEPLGVAFKAAALAAGAGGVHIEHDRVVVLPVGHQPGLALVPGQVDGPPAANLQGAAADHAFDPAGAGGMVEDVGWPAAVAGGPAPTGLPGGLSGRRLLKRGAVVDGLGGAVSAVRPARWPRVARARLAEEPPRGAGVLVAHDLSDLDALPLRGAHVTPQGSPHWPEKSSEFGEDLLWAAAIAPGPPPAARAHLPPSPPGGWRRRTSASAPADRPAGRSLPRRWRGGPRP